MRDPLDFESSILREETETPNEKLEMLSALVKENYSAKDVEVKTELDMRQIEAYSVGILFAERYKNPLVRDLVHNLMKLSISKGRKSRQEFAGIAKATLGGFNEEVPDTSLRSRLIGDR